MHLGRFMPTDEKFVEMWYMYSSNYHIVDNALISGLFKTLYSQLWFLPDYTALEFMETKLPHRGMNLLVDITGQKVF